jgi:hypothetical protein
MKENPKGRWYFGSLTVFDNQYLIWPQKFLNVEVEKKTVGQYTGLEAADSNQYTAAGEKDLRIFEGDIVKGYYFLKNEYYVGKVEYSEELSAYILTRHGHNELVWLSCFGKPNIEIIGNIHDTPELLGRG